MGEFPHPLEDALSQAGWPQERLLGQSEPVAGEIVAGVLRREHLARPSQEQEGPQRQLFDQGPVAP